jgi:tetratricopeptide (TPR) repeat protein
VRQDWQQQRDDIREDWQQHRDEARDDWQDWFGDHYGRYGGWYGGYAPGYWGRWDYLWDNYPVAAALGVTWWGANALGYAFGYSDYSNPYYTESMPAYYTEPVISASIEPVPAATQPAGVTDEAVSQFDQARAAFYEGKYEEALKLTDAAIVKLPRDAVLHEFRSLVLFALHRYAESAAALHPVLAVGPGWDWKTMSSLYPSLDIYTGQLRALEDERDKDENAKAANLRFLVGYHYLTCRHEEAALRSFQRALELQPNDTVVAALVATLTPRDAQAAQTKDTPAPKAVATDKILGNWTATGPRSASYTMNLGKDGSFTWSFKQGSRKEEAKGVYAVEGNVLAMEPASGGILAAEMTEKGPDTLLFKMIGGSPKDKGLEFQREPTK